MLEGDFTRQVVDSIIQELEKHPNTRPRHVKIKVGETFQLDAESVRAHFESLAKGTPLEGASLALETVRLSAKCGRCGWSGSAGNGPDAVCGACGSKNLDVLGGDEVVIETIDLER
jgi:hydrogenase nickel incorporation protein HypA/HybF